MPPITCPCCRATNPTGPACRRCAADLSLLFKLEADRDALLAAAGRRLADGRAAEDLLAHAESLRAGPDVHRLRAVASLLAGDFAAALVLHPTYKSLGFLSRLLRVLAALRETTRFLFPSFALRCKVDAASDDVPPEC